MDESFARKYRPKTVAEYMGTDIRDIISSRFKEEKDFPQTILLYGDRGCGKTSFARLISKEYQCLEREGGHACGHCDMCEEIENNLIMGEAGVTCNGVQEADIASDSGKADMDKLLEDALMEPMYPLTKKILILDEFHMATNQSQNRLLKIMEDVPKHLVFILCTTNPEKVLSTIKSRCQLKIEVRKANVDELVERMLYVCQQEKIKTSIEALKVIAKKAERVPREALMLLEDIAKGYGYNVTIETVQKKTGEITASLFMDFYKASNESLENIMIFNKKLKELDMSPKKFISGLTRFTLDCLNAKYGIGLEEYTPDYVKSIKKLFGMYKSEELDTLLQIIEYASKMIGDDDTKAELAIITTAMRIGKVGLLAVGLSGQDIQAEKENKASMIAYRGLIQEDAEASKKVNIEVATDSALMSVFGKGVQEIKAGPLFLSGDSKFEKDIAKEEESSDSRTLSDSELMELFGR